MSVLHRRNRVLLAAVIGSCMLWSLPGMARQTPAAGPRIAPEILQRFERAPRQTVIVEFAERNGENHAPGCALNRCATGAQKAAAPQLLRADKTAALDRIRPFGPVEIVQDYSQLNLLAVTVNRAQLQALAAGDGVVRIHENRLLRPMLDSSIPFIGADRYHDRGFTGKGTAVAVVDSPVRYWNGYFGDCEQPGDPDCSVKVWENFTTQDNRSVADGEGHGSNVAGIVLGVAPDTAILSLNVFHYSAADGGYVAYVTDELAALNWVVEHKDEYNIVAVNMSLGSERYSPKPCNDSESYAAVKALWEKDVLVAISSGNDGRVNSIGSPACITLAVATGAQFDTDLRLYPSLACRSLEPNLGEIACFSNLNGMLDIVAPGAFVSAGGLDDYGGTSMAAPHVAGAAALLYSYWQPKGVTPTAEWLHRTMQIMAQPRPDRGYVYKQLSFFDDAAPRWKDAHAFEYYYKEDPGAVIPKSPEAFTVTETVEDPGYNIGGMYAHIEVIHSAPEDVQVTVTGPQGTTASFNLPGGLDNYNGVIGKEYYPGIFKDFSGTSPAGRWSVAFTDTGSAEAGYYISVTLYWTDSACAASCDGRECGDDGCGGTCGDCPAGWYCSATRECVLDDESCKGDSCASAVEIPAVSATYEGTTLDCQSTHAAYCGGSLAGEKFYTFTVTSPTEFTAEVTGFNTVMYLYRDSCDTRARFCVEDTMEDREDGGSRLEAGLLEPGQYFLGVDGYYERGYYRLSIEACTPDCEGKSCGDDGCGHSCGACGANSQCEEEAGTCSCLFVACGDACCAEGMECGAGEQCMQPVVKKDSGGGCAGGTAPWWLWMLPAVLWISRKKPALR